MLVSLLPLEAYNPVEVIHLLRNAPAAPPSFHGDITRTVKPLSILA